MCADPDCHQPIHHEFGLSYASYFVMQRSVLEAMPLDWQRKFCALINELHEATADLTDRPDSFTVNARAGNKFVRDPYRNYRRANIKLRKAGQ